ncbi:MAG: Tol-Pal system beta propeller repeat protein TolB [Aeromonadales bacterium]|nr:Tol-Pal system beta propeller repeat protein TolB [Aeromonadales bacterium]
MFKRLLAAVAMLVVATTANAELQIEITGGINEGRKIAVYPFAQDPSVKLDVASVVSADLMRSGKFSPLAKSVLPQNGVVNGQVNADVVAPTGAEVAVAGVVQSLGGGMYNVEFQVVGLQGANKGKVVAHYQGKSGMATMRQAAHRVSDRIYEAFTGQRGCFRTRIAYVVTKMGAPFPYQLMTADYDGFNETPIVKSTQPVMTPSWSPDGTRLAYVSFEKGTPAIFVQDIKSHKRTKLASFTGLNSSPAWSPDGTKIAMTLSKDGQPDIYYFDLTTSKFVRVTANRAIDTEPTWSSDSRALYFTSERGGKAQIYKFDFNTNKTTRVTYQGARNLSARSIPGTNSLIVITQVNGYRVARVDADGSIYMLTTSSLDESPSVAPNGSMVIYSTVYQGRKGLALVSSDGRFKANLPSSSGEISAPAWGPLLSK